MQSLGKRPGLEPPALLANKGGPSSHPSCVFDGTWVVTRLRLDGWTELTQAQAR